MPLDEKKNWLFPDYLLIASIILLVMVGLIMVSSATSFGVLGKDVYYYLYRQVAFYIAAFLAGLFTFVFPNGYLKKYVLFLYFLALVGLLLVFVPNLGMKINGARRWINLRVLNFQPGEFAKLAMVILSAYMLSRYHSFLYAGKKEKLILLWKIIFPALIFAALLLAQPDFGTTLVIIATIMGMLFLVGFPLKWFLALFVGLGIAIGILAIAEPYRMARITGFLRPFDDPLGKSYQLVNSLIAIGRGNFFGVGLGDSVLKYEFLPEKHTDFIFSIIAEEFGLVGALTIVLIFSIFVWRIFAIAQRAARNRQMFACYLCYGFGLWFGLQALVNIGVVTGCLPTKGLTLPLISYGGSSLLITGMALGIILRIDGEMAYLERLENREK